MGLRLRGVLLSVADDTTSRIFDAIPGVLGLRLKYFVRNRVPKEKLLGSRIAERVSMQASSQRSVIFKLHLTRLARVPTPTEGRLVYIQVDSDSRAQLTHDLSHTAPLRYKRSSRTIRNKAMMSDSMTGPTTIPMMPNALTPPKKDSRTSSMFTSLPTPANLGRMR